MTDQLSWGGKELGFRLEWDADTPVRLARIRRTGLHLRNRHLSLAYIIRVGLPLPITFVVARRRIISGITGGSVRRPSGT
ncbi:hypothetical protein L0U85_06905 [Glycomyces sp. L485]|uniref:hypothetical protein n=1 Tax=Glycomyces sp. L485 TaxID=2909235 RepID=UPI001F4B081B|nr:hypothetical protein [Glycomyces sp. L485]MCH7230583.1 hypothetical protein [Glycomyces sp. L485]